MPVAAATELAEALLAEAGPAAVRDWAGAACLEAMQGPLFRPFAEAALATGGWEPAVLLGHACEAARIHFRGCGQLALVAVAEDGATVVQFPLAPELRTEPYLLLAAGMIRAFPVACGLEAEVAVRAGPALDRAHYDLGWWVPGALAR